MIKDPTIAEQLKSIDAEIARFDGIQDLSLVKLLRILPDLDPHVFIQAVCVER